MARKNRTELISIVKKTDLFSFTDYRSFLIHLFNQMKSGQNDYSYSSYSADLSFQDSGFISSVLSEKRNLSQKSAAKISRVLEIHGIQRRYLNTMINFNNSQDVLDRESYFASMMKYKAKASEGTLDQYLLKYFSEWYNPIIREMVGIKEFNGDPSWIKDRLNFPLSLKKIKESLKLLESLDVIKKDPKTGSYIRSSERIVTDKDVDSLNLIRCHQKNLEMAKESITRIHYQKREIRGVTLCLPEKVVPEIKEKIYEWMLEIMDKDDGSQADSEVYQLNVQFFPYTEKPEKKPKRTKG